MDIFRQNGEFGQIGQIQSIWTKWSNWTKIVSLDKIEKSRSDEVKIYCQGQKRSNHIVNVKQGQNIFIANIYGDVIERI